MYITHDIKQTSQLQLYSAQCISGSNPLDPFLLASQIRHPLTIVHVYKLYLLTYLLKIITVQSCQTIVQKTYWAKRWLPFPIATVWRQVLKCYPLLEGKLFLLAILWPAIISLVSRNSLVVPMQFPFFIFRVLCDFKVGQKCNSFTSHLLSYTIISSISKFSRGLKPPPLISPTKNFSPCNLAHNMYNEFNHSCHWPVISQRNLSNQSFWKRKNKNFAAQRAWHPPRWVFLSTALHCFYPTLLFIVCCTAFSIHVCLFIRGAILLGIESAPLSGDEHASPSWFEVIK